MRVNSSYKDFYDGVQGAGGYDQSLVYQRFPKEEELKPYPFFAYSPWRRTWRYNESMIGMAVEHATIGFCGKIYPVFILNKDREPNLTDKEYRAQQKCAYTIEHVDDFVKDNYKENLFEDYSVKIPKSGTHWRHYHVQKSKWTHDQRRMEFQRYFEIYAERSKEKDKNRFEDHHCPVFIAIPPAGAKWSETGKCVYGNQVGKIIYNGCLKPYEFFRVFDPQQAFQEISMFLGNMADPGKELPEISNQDLLEAKGFNEESFRKPKSSKKSKK